MKAGAKKTFFERLFASRLFFMTLCVIAALIAFGFARAYYQNYKIRQEILALEAQLETLKEKKFESMELLSYVLSPAYVEEQARTELNLKKPGEAVAIVDTDEVDAAAAAEDGDRGESGQAIGNPLKWWYYFWGGESYSF